MPMLEEKQSADVWCQCEVDAKWQLYRKNALLSDGLTGRTPKPDILYMFNASDLGAIGRKKRKKTLLDIYAWLLVCRKKKNVPPKSKWAQKCKADSVFFPLCQRYWWCTVDLLLCTELVPCFSLQQHIFLQRYKTTYKRKRKRFIWFCSKIKNIYLGSEVFYRINILSSPSSSVVYRLRRTYCVRQAIGEYVFVPHIILQQNVLYISVWDWACVPFSWQCADLSH